MAIFRPSATVGAISGAVGGSVFVNAKGSKVVRHRPQRKSPPTSNTQPYVFQNETVSARLAADPKARLRNLSNAWTAFTATQKTAWGTFAEVLPRANRLGQSRPLSGRAAYLSYGLTLWNLKGEAPAATVPTQLSTAPLTFTLAFAQGGPYNATITTDGAQNNGRTLFSIWVGYTAKRNTPPTQMTIARTVENYSGSATYNLYPDWNAYYEHLRTGQQVWMKCIRTSLTTAPFDWPSPPIYATTIVT